MNKIAVSRDWFLQLVDTILREDASSKVYSDLHALMIESNQQELWNRISDRVKWSGEEKHSFSLSPHTGPLFEIL